MSETLPAKRGPKPVTPFCQCSPSCTLDSAGQYRRDAHSPIIELAAPCAARLAYPLAKDCPHARWGEDGWRAVHEKQKAAMNRLPPELPGSFDRRKNNRFPKGLTHSRAPRPVILIAEDGTERRFETCKRAADAFRSGQDTVRKAAESGIKFRGFVVKYAEAK